MILNLTTCFRENDILENEKSSLKIDKRINFQSLSETANFLFQPNLSAIISGRNCYEALYEIETG